MNREDFELIDNEKIANSIKKRVFLENYDQQAAKLNDSENNFEQIFGENNIYQQIGNTYL